MSQSAERLAGVALEGNEAEYEAFYGGYWRDISSDYREDVSKAGNSFVRCIRWDNDGFRSYRNDRGLIIRKKEKEEDSDEQESSAVSIPKANEEVDLPEVFGSVDTETRRQIDETDIVDVGPMETFGRALGVSLGVNLLNQSYNNLLKPKLEPIFSKIFTGNPGGPIGKFLGQNKIALAFTGLTLLQDTGQSTSEKLTQAALSLGIGVAVRKLGPAAAFVGPAIGVIEGLMTGAPIENILAGTAGNLAGRQIGRKIGGQIFGTTGSQPMSVNKTVDKTLQPIPSVFAAAQNKVTAYDVAAQNVAAFRSTSVANPRVRLNSYLDNTTGELVIKEQNLGQWPLAKNQLDRLEKLSSAFNFANPKQRSGNSISVKGKVF